MQFLKDFDRCFKMATNDGIQILSLILSIQAVLEVGFQKLVKLSVFL